MHNELLEQILNDIKELDQKMDRVLQYLDKQQVETRNSKIKDAMLKGGRVFKKE
jgi:hypothetical protein